MESMKGRSQSGARFQQRINQMTNGFGTLVHTRDGREVGAIDRLIVDATGRQVKAAVIRKGLLLHRDVEVPLALLHRSKLDDLDLALSAHEVESLPPIHEPTDDRSPAQPTAIHAYLGGDSGRPQDVSADYPAREQADHHAGRPPPAVMNLGILFKKNLGGAIVRRGSIVTGRDGKSIGTVRNARFDPETGLLIALIIRTGSLIPRDWELTARLIAGLRDGVVYLKVDAGQLMT